MNSITRENKDYRGEAGQVTRGTWRDFRHHAGLDPSMNDVRWVKWPKMIDNGGALLNQEVAGPQYQENKQCSYEKYGSFNY